MLHKIHCSAYEQMDDRANDCPLWIIINFTRTIIEMKADIQGLTYDNYNNKRTKWTKPRLIQMGFGGKKIVRIQHEINWFCLICFTGLFNWIATIRFYCTLKCVSLRVYAVFSSSIISHSYSLQAIENLILSLISIRILSNRLESGEWCVCKHITHQQQR